MVPGYVSLVVLIGMRVDQVFARGGARRWLYAVALVLSASPRSSRSTTRSGFIR